MNTSIYHTLQAELQPRNIRLVAVSKTRSPEEIRALYDLGQRDFGENYVQELIEKQALLPADIRWHFIGHLQSNKVKHLAPFVHLVQAVDSLRLLQEIDKQAKKEQRVIPCLLQAHIAREETKFGFSDGELAELEEALRGFRQDHKLEHVRIAGLMGMASLTADQNQVRTEFRQLKTLFDRMKKAIPSDPVEILSMGMSSDYKIAMEEGSTLIRIGTALFGERRYIRG